MLASSHGDPSVALESLPFDRRMLRWEHILIATKSTRSGSDEGDIASDADAAEASTIHKGGCTHWFLRVVILAVRLRVVVIQVAKVGPALMEGGAENSLEQRQVTPGSANQNLDRDQGMR